MDLDEIKSNFEFLDDWEDRYQYVIELGKALPPLPDDKMTEDNKVHGCVSQVWLDTVVTPSGKGPVLTFAGTSDALIVKGLVAIMLAIYSGKTAEDIVSINGQEIIAELGLKDHISPQRSNGLAAMMNRIQEDARQAARTSDVG